MSKKKNTHTRLQVKANFIKVKSVTIFCVSVNFTCAYTQVCKYRYIYHSIHVEVRGQPWVLVLAFHLVWNRVSPSLFSVVYTRLAQELPRATLHFSSCFRSTEITDVSYQDQLFHGFQEPEHMPSRFHGKHFVHGAILALSYYFITRVGHNDIWLKC